MKKTIYAMLCMAMLLVVSCSTKSQVTFEIQGSDIGFDPTQITIVLANHNGDPANVYTRTTDTNTLTFVDFPHGTYTVNVMANMGYQEYQIAAFIVNKAKINHKVELTTSVRPTDKEVVSFAGVGWIVLERQGNRALVISQRILGARQFDGNSNIWASSAIRRYLNGEFYNSLSASDQSKITAHSTGDKVFLLSAEEARTYFRSDSDRVAINANGVASWWWLRSPGSHGSTANTVSSDGILDDYYYSGAVYGTGGVRPALWLSL